MIDRDTQDKIYNHLCEEADHTNELDKRRFKQFGKDCSSMWDFFNGDLEHCFELGLITSDHYDKILSKRWKIDN